MSLLTGDFAALPRTRDGVPAPPAQRAARWASTFADGLAEVRRVVARQAAAERRSSSGGALPCWPSPATLTGRSIDEADQFVLR
jgi:hypothetical protein